MKGKIFIAITWLIVFALSSCTDFNELNTNPNAPSSVTPDLLATQLMKDAYRFWNVNPTDFGSGNLFAKHTVLLETNPNPYQYYYSYSPYGSFGAMQKLTNLKLMEEAAKGNPTESSFKGAGTLLQSNRRVWDDRRDGRRAVFRSGQSLGRNYPAEIRQASRCVQTGPGRPETGGSQLR
jgi:hypothetical protein